MQTNANHRFTQTPIAASLRAPDMDAGTLGLATLDERDEDWEEFLAIALPRDPLDQEPGTQWRRTPVMLSY